MSKLRIAAAAVAALVVLGAVGFFTLAAPNADAKRNHVYTPGPYTASEAAAALHADLDIMDWHADPLLWGRNLLKRNDRGHIDIPRLLEGNVAVQGFGAVTQVPKDMNVDHNDDSTDALRLLFFGLLRPPATWTSPYARARDQARRLRRFADRSDHLTLIRTRSDLKALLQARARGEQVVGALLGLEGCHALEGDLQAVDTLFDDGYRLMAPAHFFDNDVGGSAHGVDKYGLTELGRAVVRRQEELGVVIDLSHASARVIDDTLSLVSAPVVVSHTGVDGTCDNQRNLSDAQLRAIADHGGLVAIGVWKTATCGTDANAVARAMRHVADTVGVEHVALGTDFDGSIVAPFDATGLPLVTEALMAQGFDREEIAAIMGGNSLRLLSVVLPD